MTPRWMLTSLVLSATIQITFSMMRAHFPFNLTVTPDCECPMVIDPVCGRNGPSQYTYMNECVMDCTKNKGQPVELIYRGACCRQSRCSPFDTPVCDHKGNMYESSCSFEMAQCIDLRREKRHLSMDSTSEKCSCVTACPSEWKPVCDSTGRTHANHCTFLNRKCLFRHQYNETITIDYEGTCCDDMCFTGHSTYAICDSAGETHTDLCSFYKTQCQGARRSRGGKMLKIASLGPCKPEIPDIRDTFQYFLRRFVAN